MKQTINIGLVADDGTGDVLRNAFDKVNDNFNELYGYQDIGITADSLPTTIELNTAFGLTPVTAGEGWFKLIKHTVGVTIYYSAIRSNGIAWIYQPAQIII